MHEQTAAAATASGANVDIDQLAEIGLIGATDTRRGKIAFFKNDAGALTHSLRQYGEWAENELAFLSSFVAEGDTIIDVGAYIGTHTIAFASSVGGTGKVYSLEAQPVSAALLRYNLVLNGINNVACFNKVVADLPSANPILLTGIDLRQAQSYGSMPVQREADGLNHASTAVPAVTLDSLSLGACALIKIDVEGMEDKVLRGAKNLLLSAAPVVYAECNSVDAGAKVVSELRELGYSVWMHLADAYNPANWKANPENIFGHNREVGLVGVPEHRLAACPSARSRRPERDDFAWARSFRSGSLFERAIQTSGDSASGHHALGLLFEINTLDDLVGGMLLKPQYPREVLQFTSAAYATNS